MKRRRWVARPLAWLDRRFGFHRAGNVVAAGIAVCVLFGILSMLLGQDANWDLRNYHLYNAYAWLNDRLEIDLAPAQMQSYFMPVLDVPYYGMSMHWPPLLTGFVMGALHGTAFLLVAGIAWRMADGHPRRAQIAPLLGLAGCFSAVFLAELGNTMGDNTTALPVLGALLLVLEGQRRSVAGSLRWWRPLLLAGVLLGAAVAFKLTNAVYAVAMAFAVLTVGPWQRRLSGALLLASVSLIVFAAIAGPWYWQVWRTFGNPLFPQFNAWFGSPLAAPISVADTRWLPKGWGEALAWPLLFSLHPNRISEIPMRQLAWPLLYLLTLAGVAKGLFWRRRTTAIACGGTLDRSLLVFFATAFLVWAALFSIHRYLSVLELLAPLVLWMLARRLFPARFAGRAAAWMIAACVAVALSGWREWGHEGWTERSFRVEAPALSEPARATVLLVGNEPQSWLVPFLPPEAAYVSLASNLPESPGYTDRLSSLLAERSGGIYALSPAAVDAAPARLARLNRQVDALGLADGDCTVLRWLTGPSRRVEVVRPAAGGHCRLARKGAVPVDMPPENQARMRRVDETLRRYGLRVADGDCQVQPAWIGAGQYPFLWCQVERL